jgi:hypothetical protein
MNVSASATLCPAFTKSSLKNPGHATWCPSSSSGTNAVDAAAIVSEAGAVGGRGRTDHPRAAPNRRLSTASRLARLFRRAIV